MDLVVIGLGYVGLPLAREACRAGLTVGGLDTDAGVVTRLAAGLSHVDDVSDEHVAGMLATGFHPTTDESVLAQSATIVICVPTPLTTQGAPDLAAIRAATEAVARNLRKDTLVVLESTTYPGTTDELVRPILEKSGLRAGQDFHLAFSPERIDPGNETYGLRDIPKIVGGLTAACGAAAAAFYGKFIESVHQAKGTREAELAKLLENTYRHVNIALVNEMAVFSHELGIDLWDAIDCAATKPFGFQTFHPGPGVGGHCIPIDPNLRSHRVRSLGYPFRFVELAQEINARMPDYVVERAGRLLARHGLELNRARVLLCGVTYKADISDLRESPAEQVVRRLRESGAEAVFHDPHVQQWQVDGSAVLRATDLTQALAEADVTIIVTHHRSYNPEVLARHARLVLDTKGRMRGLAADTVEVL
ncbi:nucleotide sugar dehydrogenase [Streptomyces sp. NPDC001393]